MFAAATAHSWWDIANAPTEPEPVAERHGTSWEIVSDGTQWCLEVTPANNGSAPPGHSADASYLLRDLCFGGDPWVVLRKARWPRGITFEIGRRGRPGDLESDRLFPRFWPDPHATESPLHKEAAEGTGDAGRIILKGVFTDSGIAILRMRRINADGSIRFSYLRPHEDGLPRQRFAGGIPVIVIFEPGAGLIDTGGRFGIADCLAFALARNDVEMVEQSLEAGISPNELTDGWAVTHFAATLDNEAARRLLAHPSSNPRLRDAEGLTPLHYAAARGNAANARLLLERGAGINALTDNRALPTYFAAMAGDGTFFRQLVDEGGYVVNRVSMAFCPSVAVINQGRDDLAEILLEQRARTPFERENAEFALAERIRDDRLGVTRFIVERFRIRLDRPFAGGQWATAAAAAGASVEMLEFLKANGAPLNPDIEGRHNLIHLASAGNARVIPWLAAHGVDADASAEDGVRPLHLAAAADNAEAVRVLLGLGADPNAGTAGGETPLAIAAASGYRETARLLLEGGASVDIRKPSAQFIIENALRHDMSAVIGSLLSAGDARFKFDRGFTLGDAARWYEAADTITLLEAVSGRAPAAPETARMSELHAPLQPLEIALPAYPYELQRRHAEQTLRVKVLVDKSGAARFPRLVSGSIPGLDERLLILARDWRFTPPELPDGARGAVVRVPVRFEPDTPVIWPLGDVCEAPAPVHRQRMSRRAVENFLNKGYRGDILVEIVVTDEGDVVAEDIRVLQTFSPEYSEAVIEALAQWKFSPAIKDGKPVHVRIQQRFPFLY